MQKRELVLPNSQTPFVIIGSDGGYDAIVAKSENAQLELIGYAVESYHSSYRESFLSSLFDQAAPRHNLSVSSPRESMHPESDNRNSTFRFAWVGRCDAHGQREVNELFERTVPDIIHASQENDNKRVELAISRLIALTSLINEGICRRRKRIRFISGVYALIFVITSIVVFFAMYPKS